MLIDYQTKKPKKVEKKFVPYISREVFNFDIVQSIFFVACAFEYCFLLRKIKSYWLSFLSSNGTTYHEFPFLLFFSGSVIYYDLML